MIVHRYRKEISMIAKIVQLLFFLLLAGNVNLLAQMALPTQAATV